jgi:hypothetical protein
MRLAAADSVFLPMRGSGLHALPPVSPPSASGWQQRAATDDAGGAFGGCVAPSGIVAAAAAIWASKDPATALGREG